MHRFATLLLTLVLIPFGAAPANAFDREDLRFRAGGWLGLRLFDDHQDLYDGPTDQLRDPTDTPAHAPLFGLFFGVDYRQVTLETHVELLPTSLTESDESAWAFAGSFGFLYRLPLRLWKLTPYAKLEAGALGLSSDAAGTDLDLQAGLGAGLLFPIAGGWFGRLEGVALVTDGWDDAFATNFALRVGAGYAWGFDPDRDGDGIPNRVDKCPDVAEDQDGFEDEDGCPERDNDADGVLDATDKCPGTPADAADGFARTKEDRDGFEDEDGCPDLDNDADNVPDAADKCPGVDADATDAFARTKEDPDGFADADGCPDEDNDTDGVLDAEDKCPGIDADAADGFAKTKETINGFEDEDGCPDTGKAKVQMEATQIKILDKVYFEVNEAVILPVSFNLLNQVALTLKANPHLLLVEVQGHAGTDGEEAYNDRLSAKRANAVRKYLVHRGVAPDRLVAKWYGFSRPVKTCSTSLKRRARHACEELNRRVEFIILRRKASTP